MRLRTTTRSIAPPLTASERLGLTQFHQAHCPPPDSDCPETDSIGTAVHSAPALSAMQSTRILMTLIVQAACQMTAPNFCGQALFVSGH